MEWTAPTGVQERMKYFLQLDTLIVIMFLQILHDPQESS